MIDNPPSFDSTEEEMNWHADQYSLYMLKADETQHMDDRDHFLRAADYHQEQAVFLMEQLSDEQSLPSEVPTDDDPGWEDMLDVLCRNIRNGDVSWLVDYPTEGVQDAMITNLGENYAVIIRDKAFMCGLLAGMNAGVYAFADEEFHLPAECDDDSCPVPYHIYASVEAGVRALSVNMKAAIELHDGHTEIHELAQ